MMGETAVLTGGFADPAPASRCVFRALMAALAEPGTVHVVAPLASPPAPFPTALGTIGLTLCDDETPVWLDPTFGESAARWLSFHAGSPSADLAQCAFAFRAAVDVSGLHVGTETYPDRSATLIAPTAFRGTAFTASGPGISGERTIALDLPPAFADTWAANHALFPRGVDAFLVDGDAVMGLPRSTKLTCTSR